MSKVIKVPGNKRLFQKWMDLKEDFKNFGDNVIQRFAGIAQNEMEIEISDLKGFKEDVEKAKTWLIDSCSNLEELYDESIDYVKASLKK